MYKPSVFAHRGASGRYFENTMKAFVEAFSQGAHGIELDVQLTEDGVPVVIHDMDLTRVAGIRKRVSSMTYAEIKKIRIGRKYLRIVFGHRIPSLYEVVSFCDVKGMGLNVELKETVSERPALIKEIIPIISGLKNVHISSFHYHLLEKVKEVDPEIETAYLVRKKGVDWDNLKLYTSADGFHLHKRLFTEPYIRNLRLTTKKIRVYGVTGNEKYVLNPPPFIDGWITDYPGYLISQKKRQ
ncbi:glycerophosphodiester phosphodiesterase [Sporosarcina sp. FA9]|uniref:glycerophosphodiester phosphodiesterase n=1 Tax=Sporosarcina sp. FA9 TaxID=3413030 RepID=UPI003F6561C9